MKQALKETVYVTSCIVLSCIGGAVSSSYSWKVRDTIREAHHNIHILKHELKKSELEIEVLKLKLELWRERKPEREPEQEVLYFVPANLNQ